MTKSVFAKGDIVRTALREWCKTKGLAVRVVFDTDLGNRAIKEARQLHDKTRKN